MFQVENHSPFPCFTFEKTGRGGALFDVLCIKTTYRMRHGERSDLADEQAPLVMADEYRGTDTGRSVESAGLRVETDLVLAKNHAEVHVIGHARPADGPSRSWRAGIRLWREKPAFVEPPKPQPLNPMMGLTADQHQAWRREVETAQQRHAVPPPLLLDKQLRITGPRHWEHRALRGWGLSEPTPADRVELCHELAYGGTYDRQTGQPAQADPASDRLSAYEFNPVGLGFIDAKKRDKHVCYAAAQFEALDQPIVTMDKTYAPQGFGPINRWWSPRKQRAGTFDDRWLKSSAPALPYDFDFAFFNSASSGMVIEGFLQGDEWLELEGLVAGGTLRTQLAGYEFVAVCNAVDGHPIVKRPHLDTLTIDADARVILGTWRLVIPRHIGTTYAVLGSIVPAPRHSMPGTPQPVRWDR